MYYVIQQGGQWRFRQEGYVFPIKKGTKEEVLKYVNAYMKDHPGIVQMHWETGAVEQIKHQSKQRTA